MEYPLMSAPLHINWNYTYKCNFNCAHCYSRTRSSDNELNYEQKKIVVNNIVKNRIFNVNLGGGEPLLAPDVFDIIQLLTQNKVRVNLSTNGWDSSPETIQKLLNSGISGVSISIDHIDPLIHDEFRTIPGSYYAAVKAIENYVAAGIHTTISTTITQKNYSVLNNILQLALQYDCSGVDFKRLKTMGNAETRFDLILTPEQEKELYSDIAVWKNEYPFAINFVYGTVRIKGIDGGCPCGKTSICIMDNGDLAPCVYNTIIVGNAVDDDIGQVWRDSKVLNYLRKNFSCMGLVKELDYEKIRG